MARTGARAKAAGRHRELRDEIWCPPLWAYPSSPSKRSVSGEPFWETGFDALLRFSALDVELRGEFRLRGYWRYWDVPGQVGSELRESSISVTVSEHGLHKLPDGVCIGRYDFENHGIRRGRHVHAYQPVVTDSVHWVTPGAERMADWPFRDVLTWLCDSLGGELLQAGWPSD